MGCGTVSGLNTVRNILEQEFRRWSSECSSPAFRCDADEWGTYRTTDTVLDIYDALAAATQSGQPYQTRLNPPPADARCWHPPKRE